MAGGQGYRRALGVLCAKMSGEGAPILWKGGDIAAVLRKPGPLTPSNVKRECCAPVVQERCMPVCYEQQRYLGFPCQLGRRKLERLEAEGRNSRS